MATPQSFSRWNVRRLTLLALFMVAGCSALNPSPKRSVLRTFDNVDRIVANGHEITDRETIDGLRNIYRTAKWRPFVDTQPTDQISIKLYNGTVEVLSFTYGAGWLMDASRKGVLSEEQRNWMIEHIRSKIPKANLPDSNIL